ncbi:hypothetical protein DB41_EU00030 [Neochlamydia sp. TUME1]|nr:hypothetical protein DB41_EU00030 [Neochlamydia sp. TUME1]
MVKIYFSKKKLIFYSKAFETYQVMGFSFLFFSFLFFFLAGFSQKLYLTL